MVNTRFSPVRQMVYASMFGALTALGGFIVVPLQPVPVTLQTFFAGLSGVLLCASAGALSQIVYVLLGLIGLPVFAGGKAGLGTLFGPTGGYLIGFIMAAYVGGRIMQARRQPGLFWITLALVAADVVIYIFGTLQLVVVAHLTPLQALLAGVAPFLLGDLLKLLAAVPVAVVLRKYIAGAEVE